MEIIQRIKPLIIVEDDGAITQDKNWLNVLGKKKAGFQFKVEKYFDSVDGSEKWRISQSGCPKHCG